MASLSSQEKIAELLNKTVNNSKHLHNGLLLLHSDQSDIHWTFASGTVGTDSKPITTGHSYHIASIGKAFTATLIAMLQEQGKLGFDYPIHRYLSSEILSGLHTYKGIDYSQQIQIKQLLNHRSGIVDYFEDKPKHGKSVMELITAEPDRHWTPLDTIQFSKDHLKPVAIPGKKFHYSDTGYQLLGLIIEQVTGRPMHQSLHEWIFEPLGMDHSYQLFYSEPTQKSPYPLTDIYFDKTEVSTYTSTSCDWAGGGIVSTTEDLLKFHRALVQHQLLKPETLQKMQSWKRWQWGIDYGDGLVKLKFKDFFFLLPRSLDAWGNFGSTATFMFYNPEMDVYVIGAFNQSKYVVKQVQFMMKVFMVINKMLKK